MQTTWRLMRAVLTLAVVTALAVTVAPAAQASTHGSPVTAVPHTSTPHVLDNRVLDFAEVGGRIVTSGDFTQVQDARANGGAIHPQPYIFAFDPVTGRIDRSFAVDVDGPVNAVEPGPDGTVYLGGSFTSVNGQPHRNLAQVSLATGQPVPGFRTTGINGAVFDLETSGGRLFLGGVFDSVEGVRHGGLAAVDPVTGAVDEYLGVDVTVNHNWPNSLVRGSVGVRDFSIAPDGSRLVAIGNFKRADNLERDQVVSVLLRPGGAVVDPDWRTRRYEPACSLGKDFYVREVDFSPDSSHFVIVTTGGKYTGTLCDAAARFDTAVTSQDAQPRWENITGGDTLHSVEVTDAAVYVGGHQRWLNNPLGSDTARPGAVPRPGLAALDPRTGLPLSWNPGRNPRGIGAEALLATAAGLLVGSDTKYIGNYTYTRPRLAYFPLAGAKVAPRETVGQLPSDVYLAGRATAGAGMGVDDVRSRYFTGTSAGPDRAVSNGAYRWSRARGAVLVGDTLFYGYPASNGAYYLFKRSFNGTTYGTPVQIDPYNDPLWNNVQTGSNNTYRGMVPSFYGQLSSVTAMAYRDGRLYYTRSGDARLYYRWFSPESGIVSETAFVASGAGFNGVSGLLLSRDEVYVAYSGSGNLARITYTATGVTGGTLVSGPGKDGKDWRARGLFLGPQPNVLPTPVIAEGGCLDLTCAFDGTGSRDADGSVVGYRWDFGDGTTATGSRPRKTYGAAGTWPVRLTVTDNSGASASVVRDVTVTAAQDAGIAFRAATNVAARPVTSVDVAVPRSVRAGDGLVLVLATNSAVTGTLPDGWRAVGGQAASTAMTTQVFSRVATATDAGSTLEVALSGSASVTAQLVAYAGTSATEPVASVTGALGLAGATDHTTPRVASPAGRTVLSVWSDKNLSAREFSAPTGVVVRGNLPGTGTGDVATLVADGGTPVAAGDVGGLTATVPAPSSRAVALTVLLRPAGEVVEQAPDDTDPVEETPGDTDPGDGTGDRAPVAAISSTCADLACSLDGTGSTDAEGEIVSYAWDFGDGANGSGPTAEHRYAEAGDYPVTLTVTDSAGGTGTAKATVTVAGAPVGSGVALRGSAGTAARPVQDVSVEVPEAVQPGDGLVLVLGTNSAVTGTAPAGWSEAGRQAAGTGMTIQVFSKVAAAGDAGSTVTVAVGGTGSSALTLQLLAYSGTSSAGPVTSVTGAVGAVGATAHTTPTVQAAEGSWVLSVWSDKSSAQRQFTPPAGLPERSNIAGAGNGDLATLLVDSGAPVAAGEVGGLTATVPTPSSRAVTLTVLLRPAG